MNFLLVGHSGSFNRGCEAIVRTVITLLRDEFTQPEIVISSFDDESEKLIYFGPNVEIIPARKIQDRYSWLWLKRQVYKVLSKTYRQNFWEVEYSPVISAIEKADVILSIGGDNYTMDYGFPKYFLALNNLVKKKGKKLVLWATSIGPFPEDNNLEEIVKNLQSADLITARETSTLDYLAQLGIIGNVKLVADTAFLLTPEAVSFSENNPDVLGNNLGINISPIVGQYEKGGNIKIIDEIILFLNRIIEEKKVHVLLIPHVTKPDSSNNDYVFMNKIYEQIKNTKMAHRISSNYNAAQMKYIISRCRFFIGARTHATIAALSTGVPTLSLGYSLKAKGINKDIFGNYDFLLDMKDITAQNLFDKFTKIYDNELKIREILSAEIPKLKKLALANIKYLKEILQESIENAQS